MDRTARIIGVPMDLGADRRGVDMGPSAIRYAGLAPHLERIDHPCVDAGDLPVPRPEGADPDASEPAAGSAKFLAETTEVCTRLADEVAETVDAGQCPLVLGGDHSIAIGTLDGVSRDQEVGVLWFDAHGDFNTPGTTPSGNIHGMSLAAALGIGDAPDLEWARASNISEEHVALVGVRNLDPGERENLHESEATAYTIQDIDERGLPEVIEEAIDVASAGVDRTHVSLDLDWLDPTEAPGVGTPVRGGVSYREAHVAMELVYEHVGDDMAALELVEVNPILDRHNETAELATELAASAFGQQIL